MRRDLRHSLCRTEGNANRCLKIPTMRDPRAASTRCRPCPVLGRGDPRDRYPSPLTPWACRCLTCVVSRWLLILGDSRSAENKTALTLWAKQRTTSAKVPSASLLLNRNNSVAPSPVVRCRQECPAAPVQPMKPVLRLASIAASATGIGRRTTEGCSHDRPQRSSHTFDACALH